MMIKQRIYEIANQGVQEVNKLKRKRKSPYKYYLIIIALVVALLCVGRANANNLDRIEQQQKQLETKSKELDKYKLEQEQNNTNQNNQIQELQKQVKDLQVKKAEKARLAAIESARAKPVPMRVVSAGCEGYRTLVSQYSWNADVALAVMKAESGCNPNAISPTNDHGLMQLHGIRIYDPAENIAYAYFNKFLKGGWRHWSVCNSGKVHCV